MFSLSCLLDHLSLALSMDLLALEALRCLARLVAFKIDKAFVAPFDSSLEIFYACLGSICDMINDDPMTPLL